MTIYAVQAGPTGALPDASTRIVNVRVSATEAGCLPTRAFDYAAIDDDRYDGAPDSCNRGQVGYGATEEEAIADLLTLIEDSEQ
jgi:hypothetical protein